jgi:hypothetical protein
MLERYYIRQTGYSNGLCTGQVLNRDGTVYTGNMSKEDEQPEKLLISPDAPSFVIDGFEVKIKKAKHDTVGKNSKVEILFTQSMGDKSKVVSAVHMRGYELEDLKALIERSIKDFNNTLE